ASPELKLCQRKQRSLEPASSPAKDGQSEMTASQTSSETSASATETNRTRDCKSQRNSSWSFLLNVYFAARVTFKEPDSSERKGSTDVDDITLVSGVSSTISSGPVADTLSGPTRSVTLEK